MAELLLVKVYSFTLTELITAFSYLWDRICSNFSCAGKFCLAHGLRQLTRDTESDISCLQMTHAVTKNSE